MADTHVVLIKCKTNLEVIDTLGEHIADECSSNGGKLLSLYWTAGASYDAVALVELASGFMPAFALQTTTYGVTEVVVMRAFDQAETYDMLHNHWVPGSASGHMGPRLSAPE